MAYQPSWVIECHSLVEKQEFYNFTYNRKDKRFHAFLKGISQKGNVITHPDFELSCTYVAD